MEPKKKQDESKPVWWALGAVFMLAAGIIWAYAARVSGDSSQTIWSIVDIAVAAYCWMRFLKLRKEKQG